MGSSGKLILLVIGTIAATVFTWLKRRNARKTLHAIEKGRMCLHCDSSNVTLEETGGVLCGDCGQRTSAALLRSEIDEHDFNALTRPD